MKKLYLSMSLVAGTSVGAGMLALPMVLCTLGIIPTIGLILGTWFFMYISGLLGLELNLRAGQGLPLSTLAKRYSGSVASVLSMISFIFLIYALLCAYIYGGASVVQTLLEAHLGWHSHPETITCGYAAFLSLLLMISVEKILQVNRLLLLLLFVTFFLLLSGLVSKVDVGHMPLIAPTIDRLHSWTHAIPILFTSYGFQVIFHTLTNFCNQDTALLKRAVFWGSLIPAFVYITWTVGTLSVLYYHRPEAYDQLIQGHLDVGTFIQILAQTATWSIVQVLASLITLLAILKSSLGVGLGLLETWQSYFKDKLSRGSLQSVALMLTIVPPLLISLWVPQLFLKALSFAGLSLTMIAIFIPLWLITRPALKKQSAFYPLTQNSTLQWFCFCFGLMVVLCECFNFIEVSK